jgi:hypothetical protein
MSISLKAELGTDTEINSPHTRNRRPKQSTTTTDSDSDNQLSALDNRHPTTNNKQLPPTDTPNNQNKHPTTERD